MVQQWSLMCVGECQVASQVSYVVLSPTTLPTGSLDWLVAKLAVTLANILVRREYYNVMINR